MEKNWVEIGWVYGGFIWYNKKTCEGVQAIYEMSEDEAKELYEYYLKNGIKAFFEKFSEYSIINDSEILWNLQLDNNLSDEEKEKIKKML